MVILNVVLMALINAAIVGLLVWSIFTQHRHPGYEDAGIRRRLQISVRLVPLPAPNAAADPNRATAGSRDVAGARLTAGLG